MKKINLALLLPLLFTAVLGRAFVVISPSVAEYTTDPGGKFKGAFTITNPTDQTMIVGMAMDEWWGKETRLPGLPPEKWLKLRPFKTFRLKPGMKRRISFKVKMPKEWAGMAAAMIYFTQEERKTGAAVQFQHRRGAPIYVLVRGSEKIDLSLENASAAFSGPADGPLKLSFSLRNNGNVHLRPKGRATVFLDNQPLETIDVSWGTPVFPNESKLFSALGQKTAWPNGTYEVKAIFNYGLAGHPLQKAEKSFKITIDDNGLRPAD